VRDNDDSVSTLMFTLTGRERAALMLLVALAFATGTAYWFRTMPDRHFNPSDTIHHYDPMAVSLLAHGTLGPDTTASPGYAVFLAGIYAVFGRSNLMAASFVNLALFGVLAAVVGLAGIRLFGPAGYLAGIAVALNPNFLYHAHFAASEVVFALLFVLLAIAVITYRKTGAVRALVAVVAIAVVAAFTRAVLLLYLPAVLLCLIRTPTWRGLVAPAVVLLAFLAILAPWSYRNSRLAGRPVLITDQGSVEFEMSTNARYLAYLKRALLTRGYPPGPPNVVSFPPSEFVTSEPRFPDGIAFAEQHPWEWLQLYILKLYYHLQFFNLTNFRSITLATYSGLYYLAVWTLAVIFLVRRPLGATGFVFMALIASNFLLHPLLNIEPAFRFRLPVEPFMVLLAAGGLATITRTSPTLLR
jgi:hypothetical protein